MLHSQWVERKQPQTEIQRDRQKNATGEEKSLQQSNNETQNGGASVGQRQLFARRRMTIIHPVSCRRGNGIAERGMEGG